MFKSSALRVAPGPDGVSIWSAALFGDVDPARLRDFLARTFTVQEVDRVELRRAKAFGRICYAGTADPAQIWRKLSKVLRSADVAKSSTVKSGSVPLGDAGLLYLESARATRVTRIGDALTTWRLRHQGENTLGLWHPALRNRREVVFRLEEELASILGVEDFRASALTGRVVVRYDRAALTPARLARELEKAWPRLLEGLDGPPSRKRFVAAVGLLGLSITGQYLVPAVRPVAVAGVALYSSPNVIGAAQQLRHGEVGLPALYTSGLALMLIGGMPLTATVMATLMQLWPHLGRRKLVRSQRRLFAAQRRRPAWARLAQVEGEGEEVHVDDLGPEDVIVVRSGEIIPVDGIVEEGYAAVVDGATLGEERIEDKSRGEAVAAGARVHRGRLQIRVERSGLQTYASYLDSLLPHGLFAGTPSALEAERIANRNAKPALALAAVSLLLTRTLRIAQAVIRPDYATGPRLSAQLSALEGVGEGLLRGIVFRNRGALDRLSEIDTYVFDDSAGLEQRWLEVAKVETIEGISAELVVAYARAAEWSPRAEQLSALASYPLSLAARPRGTGVIRKAGVARYHDHLGSAIEVAAPWYVEASRVDVPARFQLAAPRRGKLRSRQSEREPAEAREALSASGREPARADGQASVPPLWVLRDGVVLGVVSFARTGAPAGAQIVAALRARNERAKFVYLSRSKEADAQAWAKTLGIERAHGGLSQTAKLELIRGLQGKSLWIGDGSSADARELVAASAVSVSVGPLAGCRHDAADILVPQRGLAALPELIEVGQSHGRGLADDYRAVYTVNLLGIVGAFFGRFGGLQSGLLSHVGAGLIYLRHARRLDKLAATAEARNARIRQLEAG